MLHLKPMPLSDTKVQNLKYDLVRLIQARQFKRAEKLYPLYKNLDIKDADIWKYFAGIHSERKNIDKLIECCRKILEINPDDVMTAYNLGASLQNINRIDEAIIQYEKCIEIEPNHIKAVSNCAHLYLLTGKAEKAVIYYRKTLEKIDSPELRLEYGQALKDSGDKNNALTQFKHILSIHSENKKALFLTAQCYNELRNYNESEKHYLLLLQTDKDNVNVLNNLGRVYEESGKFEKAIELFQKAININGNNETIYINLGKALVKTGNFSEAISAFDHAIKINPEQPEPFFYAGQIYNEKNEITKARECFSKALNLDIKKYVVKSDAFILAVKFFLSSLEEPEIFNEDKKTLVADLFDGYADNFDHHLVERLQYKTPELINELIIQHVTINNSNSLDLGCGTGLCGTYLKNVSQTITGVDLSPKMIEKAYLLGYYDKLIVGEITEVVNDLNEIFDLIIAADVFGYIGSLRDIFHACSNKIKQHGYYIFSVELLPEEIKNEYKLYASGRYKHSIGYINRISTDNGFEVIGNQSCTLRKEKDSDVKGCIITLKKL